MRGRGFPWGGGPGRVSAANRGIWGGGGAKYFFFGPETSTKYNISEPIFGKGMRRSTFQWKKGFSVKRGEAIQWIRGLVRISTGKAIQWRGSGIYWTARVQTLKTEKLLSSSLSRKSALDIVTCCLCFSPATQTWSRRGMIWEWKAV